MDAHNLPWGKLSREGRRDGWLPLEAHSLDVAWTLRALLADRVIRTRAEAAAGRSLNDGDMDRLAVFACLHDIGKANHGFQARAFPPARFVGHIKPIGSLYAPDGAASRVGLALAGIIGEWDASGRYLAPIFSHHGRPLGHDFFMDADTKGPLALDLWEPEDAYVPEDVAHDLIGLARHEFPGAFVQGPPLPKAPAFVHFFAGLLMLADWIGSSEEFHPLQPYDDGTRRRPSSFYAGSASRLASMGIGAFPGRSDMAPEAIAGIPELRPVQSGIGDLDAPTVVIESETGSGKTEAALLRWAALRQAGLVDGLYMALPTRVAAVEIHARVVAFVERFLGPDAASQVVLALPGYHAPGGLNPPAPVEPGEEGEARPGQRRPWAAEHPKRFLASLVAVGTIDQALLSVVRSSHAHMRLAALSRSLLVIDEVHASNPYMTALTHRLLEAHRMLGGHALLMSATLGGDARRALLGVSKPVGFDEALATPYPSRSWAKDGGVTSVEVSHVGEPKTVRVDVRPLIDEPGEVARIALDHAARGARVLVVRNTVSEARRVFRAMQARSPDGRHVFHAQGAPAMHHGRYASSDRRLLDAAVGAAFGKGSTAEGMVLVGTQTLEMALDIDADILVTDLCPMDVLLQRLGRLHRHSHRSRPEGFGEPVAVVLTSPGPMAALAAKPRWGLGYDRKTQGGVYRNVLSLEATRRLLEAGPVITVPTDCRKLVETATHPESLKSLMAELSADDPVWKAHEADLKGNAFAQRGLGLDACYRIDEDFAGWRSDDELAATRLGGRDLRYALDISTGPFGKPPGWVVIPHWMAGDVPADAEPEAVIVHPDGMVTFTLAGRPYSYDRLGLSTGDAA